MKKMKKVKIFQELKEALEDVMAFQRGEKVNLRVTHIPNPPKPLSKAQIVEIRTSLHASQERFAQLLNVSPQAVRSWEQGLRKPRNATLKLLTIAKENPKVLLSA